MIESRTLKCLLIVSLFLLLGRPSLAQTIEIEELKTELEKHPQLDTTSLKLMADIGQKYLKINVDSSAHYARLGQTKSKEAGIEQFDFQWAKLLASSCFLKGKSDSAIFFIDGAIDLARIQEVDSLIAIASTNKAIFLQANGQVPEALETLLEVIEVGRRSGKMPRILSNALNSTGIIFKEVGAYEEAVDFYSESLEIATQRKDTLLESYLYTNIGNVYYEGGEYNTAIPYYQYALDRYKVHFPAMAGLVLENIGSCYSSLGNLDSASKYILQGYNLVLERNSASDLAASHINLASLQLLKGDTARAMALLDSSLSTAPFFPKRYNVFAIKGRVFSAQGEGDKALVSFQQGVQSARKAGDKSAEAKMNLELSDQYVKLGEIEAAYGPLKASVAIVDSLRELNDGLQQVLSNFREQKEKARLRREIDLGQKLNEQLENKWLIARWAIGVTIAFGIVLALFLRARFLLAKALIKKKESELSQAKKRLFWRSENLRYSTAHNQVNHHSLFFTVGKIKNLLESEGQKELLGELEMHLGHIRKVIDVCRTEESNLEEEISIAEGLVGIYKSRGILFKFRNTSGQDLSNIAFPTLGLLPLIENAVHYSGVNQGNEQWVDTTISCSNDRILIKIENTVAISPGNKLEDGHRPIGIENCKERISIWAQKYEERSRINFEIKDDIAEVLLDIPIIPLDA